MSGIAKMTEPPTWVPTYENSRYVAVADDGGAHFWEVYSDCSACGAMVHSERQDDHTEFHRRLRQSACRH